MKPNLIELGEDGREVCPYGVRGLGGIDSSPDTLTLVVVGDGLSLFMVTFETLHESLGVVIRSLDQWFASDIVLTGDLWWVEFLVVGSTTTKERALADMCYNPRCFSTSSIAHLAGWIRRPVILETSKLSSI